MMDFLKQLPHLEPYGDPQYFLYLILAVLPIFIGLFFKKRFPVYEALVSLAFIVLMLTGPSLAQLYALLFYVVWQTIWVYSYKFYRKKRDSKWIFYLHTALAILPLFWVKVEPAISGHQSLFGFLGISYLTFRSVGMIIELGAGVIAASGTLGQIIPPSTILIFMGDMLSGINAQVQMSKGNFAPTPVSVGDLFVGAILPSAVLVGLYMLYMAGKAVFDPKSCPATPFQREEGGHGLGREIVTALLPPLALILAVLGSILGGIATPTEAASVGSVGALLLIAIKGRFSLRMLQQACLSTATITSMVFTLLLGAAVFSIVFRILGGEDLVHALLSNLPGGTMGALISVMLVMFLLGFVLDTFEVIFIIIPITAPLLLGGVDGLLRERDVAAKRAGF